jgi:hypothetical protein
MLVFMVVFFLPVVMGGLSHRFFAAYDRKRAIMIDNRRQWLGKEIPCGATVNGNQCEPSETLRW